MTLIIFFIALGILVAVHEWGHFIVAKTSGVRVDIFSIGFGPKILGFTWHDTEYRLAPIPLGGYVKIYGQEPLEEAEGDPVLAEKIANDPDSFHSKSGWKKLATVLAGPVMNLVLCFALLPMVFMVGRWQPKILDEAPVVIDVIKDSPAHKIGLKAGDKILAVESHKTESWQDVLTYIPLYPEQTITLAYERSGTVVKTPVDIVLNKEIKQHAGYLGIEPNVFFDSAPVIDKVQPGSAADTAGLQTGDRIQSIDGKPIEYWYEMTETIQKLDGRTVTVSYLRGDDAMTTQVTPQLREEGGPWVFGITKLVDRTNFIQRSYGFTESIKRGMKEGVRLLNLTFDVLGRLFTGGLSYKTLGGPIQIAQATSSAAQTGMGEFLFLLAFLSMQLGILNLLPIPVLDGGHVVFLAIEAIRRRPISPKVRMVSMQVGMVMLLTLMVVVTVNDVNTVWGFGHILDSIKGMF